jgi:shikimate dehydrogenase
MIGAETRLLGLLGHPVSHSLSPVFQNAALQHLGLPFVYLAFDVPPDNLPRAVEALKILNARGFNVTVPHKETVCALLDHLEREARLVGAVNTVVHENGMLSGYNTDIYGFEKSLEEGGARVEGKNVLLLGAGGVSRAVVFVLGKKNIASLFIANRTIENAQRLSRFALGLFSFPVVVLPWEQILRGEREKLPQVDILINTTTLGMHGEAITLNWHNFSSCSLVIDVVYRREGETPLVEEAKKYGIAGQSGKSMLLHQGAKSFELFTGKSAPLKIMQQALEEGGTHHQ